MVAAGRILLALLPAIAACGLHGSDAAGVGRQLRDAEADAEAAAATGDLAVDTIMQAAADIIVWSKWAIDNTNEWIPEDSESHVWRRTESPRTWVQGALLTGMKDWATATNDDSEWQWLRAYGEVQYFQLGPRIYNADDYVVAQYYIALSQQLNLPEALTQVTERFDYIIANPSDVSLDHSIEQSEEADELDYSRACQFRWCWADAIFMGPPGFFQLSAATGDPKYLEFADPEFWATTDYLFQEFDDMPGGLYIRDSEYLNDPTTLDANGDFVYWSRGEGWAFSGIAAIIRAMPDTFDGSRYQYIFTLMAQAIKALQVTEGEYAGFWGPSLRAFELFPHPESSGSAFFVGGLAWGIAEGILPAEEYLDTVTSGWSALLAAQLEDGSLGWTQTIGSEPEEFEEDSVQLYGAGAFLQAAAGMLRLSELGFLRAVAAPAEAPTVVEATFEEPETDLEESS